MRETLKNADFFYILMGAFLFFVIHLILLVRWMIFIKALDLKVPFSRIISSFFIGLFFNLFLPTSTGGDVVKVWYMFKDTHHKARTVASVVSDRLCGYISIVLIATVAFIFGRTLIDDNSILILIAGLAFFASTILLVLFHEKSYSFCIRIFGRWHKIKDALMRFHYAMALLKNKLSSLFAAVGVSIISQSCLAVTWYLIARGFHQDISILYFFIFVPMTCVVASLPSIGGLGFRDAGTAYLFAKVGMATEIAVSISLINFLYMVLMGIIGWGFYVTSLSSGRVQHYQTDTGLSTEES